MALTGLSIKYGAPYTELVLSFSSQKYEDADRYYPEVCDPFVFDTMMDTDIVTGSLQTHAIELCDIWNNLLALGLMPNEIVTEWNWVIH